ncbi:cytochrome b/b6 domain-containing protein [Luminiphilus sp. nBUS_16]|uniref:cytochrome b/b6 domain-containing protein n=1 Tax=Luminiphilus sp. nBUS_16 TaxID=3395315 RepID=UPI003EB8475E
MKRHLLIRCFHWLLALGIVLNYGFLESGGDLHEWLGWALGALVLLRVLAGFTTSGDASFARLNLAPRLVLQDLRNLAGDYPDHDDHSAAGSWMIVLILTLVVLLAVTGWMQDLDAFWGEDWLQNTHEWLANSLVALAGLHVLAVGIIQFRHGIPLLRRIGLGR